MARFPRVLHERKRHGHTPATCTLELPSEEIDIASSHHHVTLRWSERYGMYYAYIDYAAMRGRALIVIMYTMPSTIRAPHETRSTRQRFALIMGQCDNAVTLCIISH